jgi:hypothetical protein
MLLAVAGDVAPDAGHGRAWRWSIGGFALRTFVLAALRWWAEPVCGLAPGLIRVSFLLLGAFGAAG